MIAILLVLGTILATPCVASAGSATTALVKQARRALVAGQHARALRLFEQAVSQAPRSGWAHYEHARAVALLRKQGLTCELDLYQGDLVDRLRAAVELHPALRWRALRDPAFGELQGTALFLGWSGHDLRKRLQRHLTRIDWHGLQYADRADSISFADDGRVSYAHAQLPGSEGTFSVKGDVVTVRWRAPGLPGRGGSFTLRVRIDDRGARLERDGFFVASDQPDECNI